MGNTRPYTDISRLESDAELGCDLIERWRLEVSDQEPRTRARIHPAALTGLLREWEAGGWEYGLLFYIVLGTEWIFRARKPTAEDLERELLSIEAGLTNPLHPVLSPVQARLMVNAVGSSIVGELEKHRFLISLKQWALPRPRPGWGAGGRDSRKLSRPADIVQLKPGTIARIGPIVASILSEDILRERLQSDAGAEAFGRALARALLGREQMIPEFEYERWKARLGELPPDTEMRTQGTSRPENLRRGLQLRLRRSYEIALSRGGWDGLLIDLSRDPKVVFEYAANLGAISILYSIDWGTKDTPDRWEGSWGITKDKT